MIRPTVLSTLCAAAFSLACGAVVAQDGLKPSKRQPLKSGGQAAAAQSTEAVSASQLEIANRVLTGNAQCEFNQQVGVHPVEGRPGHFRVSYKKAIYTMVPQETTTGAVRLEDKKAGVMWLQIPTKSMLMNSRIGQRMVDSCTQSQQRAAL